MKTASALNQLGETQRSLLRALAAERAGLGVDGLCAALDLSHNAVRQHLAALMARGFIERGQSVPSGGRPRAVYMLSHIGRELFPRNFALIAHAMVDHVAQREGGAGLAAMLTEIGTRLGRESAVHCGDDSDRTALTRALADELDTLGYEASVVLTEDGAEIETWSCVFHALAQTHPEVCRFDLAFMAAATDRDVARSACVLRGDAACRFRLGERPRAAKT